MYFVYEWLSGRGEAGGGMRQGEGNGDREEKEATLPFKNLLCSEGSQDLTSFFKCSLVYSCK